MEKRKQYDRIHENTGSRPADLSDIQCDQAPSLPYTCCKSYHMSESSFCVSVAIGSATSIGRSAVVPVSAHICQACACKIAPSDIQNQGTGRGEKGH